MLQPIVVSFGFICLVSSLVIDRVDISTKTNWFELGPTNPSKQITLTFAVKQQNTDLLIQTLLDVSTPSNTKYGNFLSKNQIFDLLQPKPESINIVTNWIKTMDVANDMIISYTPNSDMIQINTTVVKSELLLNCSYYDYQSVINPNIIVSRVQLGTDYYVPASTANHLDIILPTHRFPVIKPRIRIGSRINNPTTLRALYNLGNAMGSSPNNSIGVASFLEQFYTLSDLKELWNKYNISGCTVTNVPSNQNSGYHLEAELDTQYISSMGQKIPMTVWFTQGKFDNALMEWTVNILNATNPPLLFSISYGDTEGTYGVDYMNRLDINLAAMGARGISIFFASGDSGAGGGCTTGPFQPDYPASSPFVTAIGGLTGGTTGQQPLGESVWIDGGGGFSTYAPTQVWQMKAVNHYLSNYSNDLPSQAKYNSSGRGYPDLAAQATDFRIIAGGTEEGVSGTSCSSPTVAGIFGLLNDLRLQNNMKPLGFLNPFIYQIADLNDGAFSDVTDGFNIGCAGKGFPAEKSWDAASGFGSPNYAKLKTHVLETGKNTQKYVV